MSSILEFNVDIRQYEEDDDNVTIYCLAVDDDKIYLKALDVNRFVGWRKKFVHPESCSRTCLRVLIAEGVVHSCPLRSGLKDVVLYNVPDAVGFVFSSDESKGKILRDLFVRDLPLVYASEERMTMPLPSVTAMIDVLDGNSPMKALYRPMSEIVRNVREVRERESTSTEDCFESTYEELVDQILSAPILKQHMDFEEAKEPAIPNLVSFRWKKQLNRMNICHSFRTLNRGQKIVRGPCVTLVVQCSLSETKGFAIVATVSEPLIRIARDVTYDLKGDCRLETSFKFKAKESFNETGIFDGTRILACFPNTIQNVFGDEKFTAIVKVRFESRELYRCEDSNAQVVRIGGTVERMLALDEISTTDPASKKQKLE